MIDCAFSGVPAHTRRRHDRLIGVFRSGAAPARPPLARLALRPLRGSAGVVAAGGVRLRTRPQPGALSAPQSGTASRTSALRGSTTARCLSAQRFLRQLQRLCNRVSHYFHSRVRV